MADLPSIQMDLNERGFEKDLKSTFLLDSKVVKLYDYHDVPYFLRGNPYVTSGYRAFLSFKMCIKRFVEGAVVFLPWVWLCFVTGCTGVTFDSIHTGTSLSWEVSRIFRKKGYK